MKVDVCVDEPAPARIIPGLGQFPGQTVHAHHGSHYYRSGVFDSNLSRSKHHLQSSILAHHLPAR
jgi:hypothetical protein